MWEREASCDLEMNLFLTDPSLKIILAHRHKYIFIVLTLDIFLSSYYLFNLSEETLSAFDKAKNLEAQHPFLVISKKLMSNA